MTTIKNATLALTHYHNEKTLSQLCRLAFVTVALCVGIALSSSPALAQQPAPPGLQSPGGQISKSTPCNFTFTAPPAGALIPAQSNVTITWTGCPPQWKVNLSLIDVAAWTVVASVASSIPNTGRISGHSHHRWLATKNINSISPR